MKKILVISTCFWMVASVSLTAQVINDSGQHGRMTLQTKKGNSLNGLEGSPYENENFQVGKITMEGNKPVTAFLRYDVLNDDMEIKTELNGEDIYVLPNKKITEYSIGANRFLYQSLQHDGKLIEGYFKEYFKGENVRLLTRLTAIVTEPYKAKTGYEKDRPSQIIIQENYFLSFKDGRVEEVKLKEKDFKKALPSSKAVNSYFSDNKLRDLEDYIKFLEWYDKQE